MRSTLTYDETIQLTSGPAMVTHYFALNGLYDPNITGTGHQPMYYDQIMALYNHYHVLGTKMTIKVLPDDANTTPSKVVLWQNDNNALAASSTIDSLSESQVNQSGIIGSGAAQEPMTLTLFWSAKKTFGGDILANGDLQGGVGSNPAELSYGCISLQSMDGATVVSCYITVKLEFITVFDEFKELSPS